MILRVVVSLPVGLPTMLTNVKGAGTDFSETNTNQNVLQVSTGVLVRVQ